MRINWQCPKAPVKLVNLSSFKVHVRRERILLYRFWEFVQTSFSVVGNTFLPATVQIWLCVKFCDLASGAIASLAIITLKLGKVTDFKVFFPAAVTLHNRYDSNVENNNNNNNLKKNWKRVIKKGQLTMNEMFFLFFAFRSTCPGLFRVHGIRIRYR